MKEILQKKYDKLFEAYGFEKPIEVKNINSIISRSLKEFFGRHDNIAIYCNGGHTRMLMTDFMFELKTVKYIVDNYSNASNETGFCLIKDEDIEERGIDAVIISSYKHKDKIVEGLKKNHPSIDYLNIYDKFMENGINLQSDYYYYNHPFHHYRSINTLQREIETMVESEKIVAAYTTLVTCYIHIKYFFNAIKVAKKMYEVAPTDLFNRLILDLEDIYETEKCAATQISERNVLLFCLDGLRRQDMTKTYMPKLTGILENSGLIFNNAYSYSTSTFESLIPVYSENTDLRTEYYNKNFVDGKDCRFLQEAIKQGRHIYFYTDMDHYIEGDNIHYSGIFQTVTEKLWNFIMDAVEEENGLFYIHELYESHFAFSNPYTKTKLIAEGTAILFDYLPQKGGKLRTDYEQQHIDALCYLDDVVSPLIQPINCEMLLYADHGNLILHNEQKLETVKETKLVCDEEWIRIACAVRSPRVSGGSNEKLFSLMELNNIVISMLRQESYQIPDNTYIKCARSELYNPDFRYLYQSIGKANCLLAFEAYIFFEGYKLVIFADGTVELFSVSDDNQIYDKSLIKRLVRTVSDNISVCGVDKLEEKHGKSVEKCVE